jgi:hypothetical protein
MADELIPLDVRDFIIRHIDSIAQLEALLLLLKKQEIEWRVADVASHLYIGEDEAKMVLDQLCADGLAGCSSDVYWLNSGPGGQKPLVESLAALYSKHLIPVTNLVHSKPSGLRAFADAFKWRKDK